jgi:hypothetical protein
MYIEKEDYEGALHICQQKLNDISKVLGDTHPPIGNLFLKIGDILRKYCNNDEALLYYEKALTIFYPRVKKLFGHSRSISGIPNHSRSIPNQGCQILIFKWGSKEFQWGTIGVQFFL